MNLDLEKLSKEEIVQLFLAEQKRANEKEITIEESNSKITDLKRQNDNLLRMLYGSRRERFEKVDPNQMKISFEEYASEEEKQDETPVKEKITYERKKKSINHNGRNPLPEHLEVVECVIEPKEDTSEMKKIGEERTEVLEFIPAKFFKLVFVRPKYARLEKDQKDDLGSTLKNIVIAPMPSRPIEKCLAGNDLLSSILVNKYVDHLPLYRQQQIFKRSDIEIASSTIDSWMRQLGRLLEPLYDRLASEVKAQTYLQADETTTKVLDKDKKGKSHLGYYWAYHAPLAKLVAFDYQKGRSKDAARNFLEGYSGALQTDGYAAYKHYYANKNVTHLACWAHARRKFYEAKSNDKKRADYVLGEIQKLYSLEKEIKDLSSDERKKARLDKALPVINDLGQWLRRQANLVLPKSPIGKAIDYTTKLWDSLTNYLYDGNLKIDNNLIENKIRPIALGRKNYLFAGSHNGAKRSAMFYSFFACCKLNDIEPLKWMQYILENIAEHKVNKLHELLPNNIDQEKLNNFKKFWEV